MHQADGALFAWRFRKSYGYLRRAKRPFGSARYRPSKALVAAWRQGAAVQEWPQCHPDGRKSASRMVLAKRKRRGAPSGRGNPSVGFPESGFAEAMDCRSRSSGQLGRLPEGLSAVIIVALQRIVVAKR